MMPVRITPGLLRTRPLPWPQEDTDKNTRGTVLVAGGSPVSPGAVTLSGLSALRAGAGKLLLAVPQRLSLPIAIGFPEAGVHAFADGAEGNPIPATACRQITALLPEADVALIGPGLAEETSAQDLAHRLIESISGPALVIDALSLTGLWNAQASMARHRGKLVITPHAGEMAQLTGMKKDQITAEPMRVAQDVARRLGCVVILKGATTVIAQPDEESYLHEGGMVGLATSGSGDVLAGVLAGLMARGADAVTAALWSVYLHGQAGRCLSQRIGPLGFLARELPAEIPMLMHALQPTAAGA